MINLDKFEVYSDGSYLNGNVGYGAVILKNGQCIHEIYGRVSADYAVSSRQVGGEIKAVEYALTWCNENSVNDVTIYYDFENIEKWATGKYKTNKPLTQKFKSFIGECSINIKWVKVKSHIGIKWNEAADVLAKKGTLSDKTEVIVEPINDKKKEVKIKKGTSTYVEKLNDFGESFAEFLCDNGFRAVFKGVFNSCDGIIEIWKEDLKIGNLHVYNTAKKNLSPAYHDIKNEKYRDEVEKLLCIYKNK